MSQIQAESISVAYGSQTILSEVSARIAKHKITSIIGVNGCGKSTLLKAMTRIMPICAGQIVLEGQAIAQLPTKVIARKLALLPQVLESAEGVVVYDLISYGRYPHQSVFGGLTQTDRDKIAWAMAATGVSELAHVKVDSLSGGQRQRVWIAMALAQDTDIIFLDEPTTYLDMHHQLDILSLLKTLNKDFNKTIIMVLHDINLAAKFSDEFIAMKAGQIAYHLPVKDMMTKEILRDIFAIDATIIEDPIYRCPILLSYQLLNQKRNNNS